MRRVIFVILTIDLFLLGSCDTKTKNVDSCGDGFLDPGEQCDGSQTTVTTCTELGYYEQVDTLRCKADCTFDLAVCTGGRCGDGIIQAGEREDCDGENLAETTCVDLQLGSGTLACKSSCRWDTSGCEVHAVCGDGTIAAPYEQCEPEDLGGNTCETLGYYEGELACADDCLSLDESGCEGRCGDHVVQAEENEDCDGSELAGGTCESVGFYEGDLGCGGDCRYSTSDCSGRCGDGTIQATYGEDCDGAELDDQTCVTRGFGQASGALSCDVACAFDEAACVPRSTEAELATLTVSSGALTPAFSAGTASYTVSVPPEVTTLTVTATPSNPYASVSTMPAQPMTLSPGANPVSVTVIAESGAEKVYTVVVTLLVTLDYESPNIGILNYVPGGTFQRDATPTNLSTVTAFRMSRTEITREQWTAVTAWADPSNATYSSGTGDPVQMVSWYDAIAFCNKLSLLEGLTPVYAISGVNFDTLTYAQIPASDDATWNAATANWSADGYRLPTEMEWMWAAMGADSANPGATNTTGYTKAFAGDSMGVIGDYAVFGYSTVEAGRTTTERTGPVGGKLPNELGLNDLSGNVSEWCWDWYGASYPTGIQVDTRGEASGTHRLLRGGDWYSRAEIARLAQRSYYVPNSRYNFLGFRVVRP